jgi:uncharacterized membrane protein YfcA
LHLETWQWVLACFSTFLIGLSKTGIAGLGILSITLFSIVLPARESVGLVLVLLICADIVAVKAYHRHAVWSHLWGLFPWTITGVVLGRLAMGRVDDILFRKMIGVILIGMVFLQFWERFKKIGPDQKDKGGRQGILYVAVMGIMAGFTTMVANAAGPIMILYLLATGLPKMEFIGTGAWYFLLINVFKVPFSYSLGLINTSSLSVDFFLAPCAIAGALVGRLLIKHINQRLFETTALILTLLASLKLLF